MPLLHLTTFIAAPPERVFDLSRSKALHKFSMSRYGEQIVSSSGGNLMEAGDEVTWTARHLGKIRRLKVRLTHCQRPHFFADEQVEGDFRLLKHEHYFKPVDNGTLMIDQFHFETPYGWIGRLVNRFYLANYLKELLTQRNEAIRQAAESNGWKQFLTT
jgi:ligand-binding SRPBCC domain-containing protein